MHTTRAFEVVASMVQRGGWRRVPEYDGQPSPAIRAEAYVLPLVTSG